GDPAGALAGPDSGKPSSPEPHGLTFGIVMARLRTLRWAFALLLLASPAIGGQAAPLVHPCAAEDGAQGHHAAPGADAHDGHHGSTPDATDQPQCSCIGTCAASALPAQISASVTVPGAVALPVSAPRIVATPFVP